MDRFCFFLLSLLGVCLFNAPLSAQEDTYNATYLEFVRSVRFYPAADELAEPVLSLGQGGALILSFDDLSGDNNNYWYVLEQRNADWSPGQLSEFEWLQGFNNNRIEQQSFSFAARAQYMHHRLVIPNREVSITKSGNYLLKVYLEGDELALVRRFMVVENQVVILPITRQAAMVEKARTHQEIDFSVDLKKLEVRNPRQEIRAAIVQNGYWQQAVSGIEPFFVRDRILDFDYQDRLAFPACREFRFFDLRSLINRSERIMDMQQTAYQTDVYLVPDRGRAYNAYLFNPDANGKFVIQNFDIGDQADIYADYANIHFTYEKPLPFDGADLYVLGAFNDFRPWTEYRMEYSEADRAYHLNVMLKQGYYNYAYGLVSEDSPLPDFSETEGNWYETENDYLILVYYRPIGERYDRIIGARSFKAFER